MKTFEIHITNPKIQLDNSWKELVIELDKGDTPIQPMFSKYVKASYLLEVISEYSNIPADRIKIEQYSNLPNFVEWPEYYEYHIKVNCNKPELDLQDISAKLSRNPQKDGRFITLRGYCSKGRIDSRFNKLLERIKEKAYAYSNIQKELVVYDNNKSLDKGW